MKSFLKTLPLTIGAIICTGCQNNPDITLTTGQLQIIEALYTAAGGEVKYRIVPVEPIKK